MPQDGRCNRVFLLPRRNRLVLLAHLGLSCLLLPTDDDDGAAGVDGNDEDSKLSQAELDKVAVSVSPSGVEHVRGGYVWRLPVHCGTVLFLLRQGMRRRA